MAYTDLTVGNITIPNTNNGTLTINNGTGTIGIGVDNTTQTINFGASAGTKLVSLGSITSTSNTAVQGGTGGIDLTATNGHITMTSGTGTIGISTDSAATTVNISTGSSVKTLAIGSTFSTSTTTLQSGSGALNVTSTNGTLTINSGTGGLNISNDAAATTINIGTGGGVKGITLGSTNTTSSTKIQSGSGGTILAGYTGLVYANNASAVTTYAGGTTGNILVDNGTSWTSQAPGMNFITSLTPSGVASVAFTSSNITSTYSTYVVVFSNVVPATNLDFFMVQFSTDNGSTYLNANYQGDANVNVYNSATISNGTQTTLIQTGSSIDNTASRGTSGIMTFYGLPTTKYKFWTLNSATISGGNCNIAYGGGLQSTASAVNNIKFFMNSGGNISTGTISLYGMH